MKDNKMAAMLVGNSMKDEIILLISAKMAAMTSRAMNYMHQNATI
jgi:hypothetical protein